MEPEGGGLRFSVGRLPLLHGKTTSAPSECSWQRRLVQMLSESHYKFFFQNQGKHRMVFLLVCFFSLRNGETEVRAVAVARIELCPLLAHSSQV